MNYYPLYNLTCWFVEPSANYRDELYKECAEALQDGLLLVEKDFKAIKGALQEAFLKTDNKLLKRWGNHNTLVCNG